MFPNPDYLKAFNTKWRKRLHKNKKDKAKVFPLVEVESKKAFPPTSFVQALKQHSNYTNSTSSSTSSFASCSRGLVVLVVLTVLVVFVFVD